jgi:hypothetical protein
MGVPIFTSNRSQFYSKNESFVDMVLGKLAMDVEIALKTTAGMPVDTGNMKSQTRFFKNKQGNWRTEVDTAYAAYQEAGMRADGSHRVRNYTTSGTSPGFFQRAIGIMIAGREARIMESAKALNL